MKKEASSSTTTTNKRRASRVANPLVAGCCRCNATANIACTSVEGRSRGKTLRRCHTERYVAARELTPAKQPRAARTSKPTTRARASVKAKADTITNNVSEVLELGRLSGGFSPVPLIFMNRVVDVDIAEVFPRAQLIAATLLAPPKNLQGLKLVHEESYVARFRLGDRGARDEYLQLIQERLSEAVGQTSATLPQNDLVHEDMIGESKMVAVVEFGRWIPRRHGDFTAYILPKLVERLKARASERLFDRINRGTENNIANFAMYGAGTGMPLTFNGRVVEDDPMQAAALAKQLGSTMGRNAPQNHKKIGLEHEFSYVARFRLGDTNSAWEFIHVNAALVTALVKKAKRMLPGNDLSEEDLCAEGRVGAFEAFKRWNPGESRFSTYAFNWILSHLQTRAARGGSTIAVRQELHLSLSRAKSEGRVLSETEAALDRVRIVASIDDTSTDHEGKTRAYRVAGIASDHDVEGAVAAADAQNRIKNTVRDALGCLSERERRIIVSRMFGGDEETQVTLEELGQQLGVSRERVRQIEANARRKMRVAIEDRFGGTKNVLMAMGA